jgi:hypothetical protein
MFGLALAGVLAFLPATTPPDDTTVDLAAPPEVSQRFLDWAEAQGTPVQMPACIQIAAAVICYGLTGSFDTGYTGTIVALDVLTDDEPDFVLMPFGVPAAPASTPAPSGTAGAASFSNGHYIVGTDVAPGMYTTTIEGTDSLCTIETFSDLTATETINWDWEEQPGTYFFEVTPDAAILEVSECGTWEPVEN